MASFWDSGRGLSRFLDLRRNFRVSFFRSVRTIFGVGKTPFLRSLRLIVSGLGWNEEGFWEEREMQVSMAENREGLGKKMGEG